MVHLRWKRRPGPVLIAGELGLPASTVHAVLVRCRLNRLTHVDRWTGQPARRYEHEYPASPVHVDVKKLGNVPHGGAWWFAGREQATATASRRRVCRAATPTSPRPVTRSCTPP